MTNIAQEEIPNKATQLFLIGAPGTDDIALGLFGKNCLQTDGRYPPVLLVHGATFGAALFDLPRPGYSMLCELARPGRSVYALDIRGYGTSLRGQVMDAPPEANPPFARLSDAVADVAAAVRFILGREQVDALDMVGFSWGTVASAYYAGEYAQTVARLALYAPLYAERNEMWLAKIGDPQDRTRIDRTIGAYRLVTLSDLIRRWDADIGWDDPRERREEGLPEAIFAAFCALDPQSHTHSPPAFRAPTGALADLVRIFNGQPLYDPAKITMPVLLVRGANDTTSTDSDARRLLSAIASADKNYRIVTPGSHFLCVENNRTELYECLNEFLVDNGGRERPAP